MGKGKPSGDVRASVSDTEANKLVMPFLSPTGRSQYRTQHNFDELERIQRNTRVLKWLGDMLCKEKK